MFKSNISRAAGTKMWTVPQLLMSVLFYSLLLCNDTHQQYSSLLLTPPPTHTHTHISNMDMEDNTAHYCSSVIHKHQRCDGTGDWLPWETNCWQWRHFHLIVLSVGERARSDFPVLSYRQLKTQRVARLSTLLTSCLVVVGDRFQFRWINPHLVTLFNRNKHHVVFTGVVTLYKDRNMNITDQ